MHSWEATAFGGDKGLARYHSCHSTLRMGDLRGLLFSHHQVCRLCLLAYSLPPLPPKEATEVVSMRMTAGQNYQIPSLVIFSLGRDWEMRRHLHSAFCDLSGAWPAHTADGKHEVVDPS